MNVVTEYDPNPLKIDRGLLTFAAEGNDIPTSRHFSRLIHWPGTHLSGVTIGRGYDMGNRSQAAIKKDLIAAGVSTANTNSMALAAGLKGKDAELFVKKNKGQINNITRIQEIRLFNLIYPSYESRAKNNYNLWTKQFTDRYEWENLDKTIRDVMVDFVYQGYTQGPNPMKAGMKNNKEELINYIKKSPELMRYEPGRNRIKYIQESLR